MVRLKKGFTLIELLIVVAIIAILAAIAVPNFLEAQVRAKVSRAKSDERTIATALEMYTVDNNKPIISYGQYTLAAAGQQGPCGKNPGGAIKKNVWIRLTSPVAYITTIPFDPFRDKGVLRTAAKAEYNYLQYEYDAFWCPGQWTSTGPGPGILKAFNAGYTWDLWSIGPSRTAINWYPLSDILTGTISQPPNPGSPCSSYDPSNGTSSIGLIVRTNKGEFTTSGK